MIRLQTAAGPKPLAAISALTVTGSRPIARMSVLTPNGSVSIFQGGAAGTGPNGHAVAIEPPDMSSGRASGVSVAITTPYVEASSNGRTPLTFAWSEVSADGDWRITDPADARTRFTCLGVDPGTDLTAVFKVEATEAGGAKATAQITVTVTNYGDPRGALPTP